MDDVQLSTSEWKQPSWMTFVLLFNIKKKTSFAEQERMSDDDKSGSEGEEEPTQTLASSRTRRDNAGKRF